MQADVAQVGDSAACYTLRPEEVLELLDRQLLGHDGAVAAGVRPRDARQRLGAEDHEAMVLPARAAAVMLPRAQPEHDLAREVLPVPLACERLARQANRAGGGTREHQQLQEVAAAREGRVDRRVDRWWWSRSGGAGEGGKSALTDLPSSQILSWPVLAVGMLSVRPEPRRCLRR